MEQGSNVPSAKLTATTITAVILAVVARTIEAKTGAEWIPSPLVTDAVALAVGYLVGYLTPELFPPRSAAQALRRRT